MDDKEHEELLIRLDERTERMETSILRRLGDVEQEVGKNREALDKHDGRIQSNENDLKYLKGAGGGVVAAVSAGAAKIFGFLKIL